MPFWSGDKLLFELQFLIDKFDPDLVDCASYRLRLGEQAFVTSDQLYDGTPTAASIQFLDSNPPANTISINPGQFAFLLTDEVVTVPKNAIALISMRAGLKFKGLINVSGFHVDPGFKGRLIFGVYNAGPAMIVLQKLDPLFLIVYADLDQTSSNKHSYTGKANGRTGIGADLVQGMAGQVFSPMLLQRRMREIEDAQRVAAGDLADMKGRGRVWDTLLLTFIGLIATIVVAVATTDFAKATIGGWIKGAIELHNQGVKAEAKVMKDGDVQEETSADDKIASKKNGKEQ